MATLDALFYAVGKSGLLGQIQEFDARGLGVTHERYTSVSRRRKAAEKGAPYFRPRDAGFGGGYRSDSHDTQTASNLGQAECEP